MKKTVLITGTSSGVGLSTAVLLATKGYRVFATMRNTEKQDALAGAIEDAGATLTVMQLDVVDPDSIANAVEAIIDEAGGIDVLVNNAGAGFAKHIERASEEEMQWVTDVNYFGVVRCSRR